MKIYKGTNSKPGFDCVIVTDDENRRFYALPPRNDVINHSPTGFSWGYQGSGPAQLALAILIDHMGDEQNAEGLYQDFKRDVIAHLSQNRDWVIDEEAINHWLQNRS